MGGNGITTDFLKECMADSLLKLMQEKDFAKITINEIAAGAGVNRSTWFRHFNTKNDAITFKLVHAWKRWSQSQMITESHRYTTENARDFFQFNFEHRQILTVICNANLNTAIYDAFYQVMLPQYGANPEECYERCFYANGLFGLLDEWQKRGFRETPEEMTRFFLNIIHP